MSPTEWDEFPRGSTEFDADIPLATEEKREWEDPEPVEHSDIWDRSAAPTHFGKRKLKKTPPPNQRGTSGQAGGTGIHEASAD